MITRRSALKRLGAVAGAAMVGPRFLAACGDNTSARPKGITHFIQVCMENRSFDHWLGGRKLMGLPNAGDGLVAGMMSNKKLDGTIVTPYAADLQCVPDPPHGWDAAHAQFNAGAMDGFVSEYQKAKGVDIEPAVMEYMTGDQIPWTWALAEKATICDRWFSGMMGPTWPNRLYLHTAQCAGLKSNMLPAGGSFTDPTIYDRLNGKNVTWTYYWSDIPVAAFFPNLSTPMTVKRVEDFFRDCADGTLAQVTVVEPAFTANDDHPPHHPMLGQQFLSSVYTALATSPLWENCMLVITYDEQGGFFDHVPPPKAPDLDPANGFDQLGFRVPTIITGPYVKQSYTSSVVYNHGSMCKHIESMFDLEPLTPRDAAAPDLMDAIDTERLAAGDPAPPFDLPPITVDESMITDACMKRSPRYAKYEKNDFEKLADTGYFGDRDRRKDVPEILRFIGDYLEKHGKGGINYGK